VAALAATDGAALEPVISRAAQLPDADRPALTACGTLAVQPLANERPPRFWHWGLVLEGRTEVSLFFELRAQGAYADAGMAPATVVFPETFTGGATSSLRAPDGGARRVCATGRYFAEYPLPPGDPPHASRFSGRWLYDVALRPE
jgi:hypothetical protein